MKNFPHQINDIPKLVAALAVYQDLLQKSCDVTDDDVFGYAMAEALVYQFRNQKDNSPEAIAARIATEKTKSASNQGARTAARDIRRFFELANFATATSITKIGENILEAGSDVGNPIVCHLWHNAMMRISIPPTKVGYEGHSHHYRVLLKLVEVRPSIPKDRMALALEAEDDTDEEFERILSIADESNWYDLIDSSESMRKNAVKILPAIARQIGDITDAGLKKKKQIIQPDKQRREAEEEQDKLTTVSDISPIDYPQEFSYAGKPKAKQEAILRSGQKVQPRDRLVAVRALMHANHLCEGDPDHPTFIRRSDNKPYTEPHHLIPLAFSDNFDVSLDVEENIVSLCSTCHNLIHYGKDAAQLIKKLYMQRGELLRQVGLELTLEELLKMY